MKMLSSKQISGLLLITGLFLTIPHTIAGNTATKRTPDRKPTIVLVHGAFAESASWDGVLTDLIAKGYPVLAVANPLRGVKSDADYVAGVLKYIQGPIVLVGHSYGGMVISDAVHGNKRVKALVYVDAFAPDTGESASGILGRFPGSTLGPTLAPPVPLPGGGEELFVKPDKFRAQFAADVPVAEAKLMADTQRPVTSAALNESASAPAWKSTSSWFIYGSRDLNIPPAALSYMAKRAHSKESVVIRGASHMVMVSHPRAVATLIEHAAATN